MIAHFVAFLLEHFVEHKPLIYIECDCGPTRCRKKSRADQKNCGTLWTKKSLPATRVVG